MAVASRAMRRVGLLALFLTLAYLAFGPALKAPFDFDDGPAIASNTTIRTLWPPSALLHTPALGTAASGRPIANYSFALNYALNRSLGIAQSPDAVAPEQTVGYHAVNIALHVLAALLLFAVIRLTMRLGAIPESWRDAADRVALVSALVWLVHPIQTEAVDYVSQRTELLVSVCYLATLYAAIRAWDEPARTLKWSVLAVTFSLVGMGSKEVMITAPIMVILYDRAFLTSSWTEGWRHRARRWLYVALLATAAWSVALVVSGARAQTAGFGAGMSWYRYFYSQAWAISHYLRLAVWPSGLSFDYGRDPVNGLIGVPGLLLLTAAGIATIVAWRHAAWRWLGFLGAWFFLLLAPSSSIVPIRTEIAAERRIYLALAAVIVLAVVGAEWLRRRATGATTVARNPGAGRRYVALAGLVVLLASLTAASHRRSSMYLDLDALWRDAIERYPLNARAYDNLAAVRMRENPPRLSSADSLLRRAMAVDPAYAPARIRSAAIAMEQHRLRDAEDLLGQALRLHPADSAATDKMGKVQLALGRPDRALPYVRQIAALSPGGESLTTLGLDLLLLRQIDSAIVQLKRAAALDSTRIDTRRYLGAALVEQERGAEAIPYLERAVRLEPAPAVIALLSLAYAQAGQVDHANQAAGTALSTNSSDPTVYVLVGRALQTIGWFADAKQSLERAVRLSPADPQALTRLGITNASMGNGELARRLFRRALEVAPHYPLAVRAIADLDGHRNTS
ncbi:MAG: hypothetical protein JWM41_141 [Gemmatimonadetes bacterium]|nr:hypothetical protein [Gemmatimonadota bacterium]